MSLKALSDFTFYSRYSRYSHKNKRRETWGEAVTRMFDAHRTKYEKELKGNDRLREEIDFAEKQVMTKRVLGSQRALQYGGEPTLRRNERIYNCSGLHIDKPKAFQDVAWVLLAGCGAGFSIQKQHVNKLPKIKNINSEKIKVFNIPDTCEGWADSVGVLLSSYFENGGEFPEYLGSKVKFKYGQIRERGALIAGQFKAPGPEPLNAGLEKIRNIIEIRLKSGETKLRPIDCYDILMHEANFVVSAGLRRSATICLFSKDDTEMIDAKTGNWFIEHPQRGRSNNSVVIKRDEITKKEFDEIFHKIKEFGEPGWLFVDDLQQLTNPCLPKWAKIITKDGIRELKDVKIGDKIWSSEGWTEVKNKWSNGVKKVFEYKTTASSFYSTKNHQIVSNGEKIEIKDAENIDIITGQYDSDSNIKLNNQDILDGIVFGDGSFHRASNNLVYLCIGENDYDYFNSEIKQLIIKHRPGLSEYAYEISTTLQPEDLGPTYERQIPDRFYHGNKNKVCSFLRGLYSANGSICAGRITLKASSFEVIKKTQEMLSFLGIRSYYTTNLPNKVEFSNGEYLCKQSYDLNISIDREKFHYSIGFLQKYKNEKVNNLLNTVAGNGKNSFDIKEINLIGEEEVFDLTVDNPSHTFWCSGVNTSNCCEIQWHIPENKKNESTVGFCNLSEINGKFCDTEDKFLQACRAAAIIGTLQAGYTDFPYLGKSTEDFVKKEALLGVSITGWMDNPEVLFNPKILEKGANETKKKNKEIADMLGINCAARICTAKPSGHTSCILGTASGIHPHHARRYIRRVQSNKQENAIKVFKQINPLAVEESIWSTNRTDEVAAFLCEVPAGAIVKNQLSAIELLEKVKLAQKHWVQAGINDNLNSMKGLSHSVSNTITVRDGEWDEVRDYIFKNRDFFTGISLLSASGDLDYQQAPFSTVLTPNELVKEYGDASVFASGLVVDGLHAFDNNLWNACDAAMGQGEKIPVAIESPIQPVKNGYTDKQYIDKLQKYLIKLEIYNSWFEQVDWVRRARQFAERYFDSDIKKATYCLKHISLWKTWCDLKREYQDIDWSLIKEEEPEYKNADEQAAIACNGMQCELAI